MGINAHRERKLRSKTIPLPSLVYLLSSNWTKMQINGTKLKMTGDNKPEVSIFSPLK